MISGVTVSDTNSLKNAPGCCKPEPDESKAYPCKNERKRCGDSPRWCANGQYRCSPENDDRFDRNKNILTVASNLQKKKNVVSNICLSSDINECIIAANNIGECIIKAAAIDQTSPGWNEIYRKITPNIMNQCSKTYGSWSPEEKEKKINNLGPYVSKVMQTYRWYQSNAPPSS
jgi:hypothetical protein